MVEGPKRGVHLRGQGLTHAHLSVGNATFPNGTAWAGNLYNTTVEWVEAGVLLNATSEGINHPSVALPGQPTQDGRVAVLTVRQLKSARCVAAKQNYLPQRLTSAPSPAATPTAQRLPWPPPPLPCSAASLSSLPPCSYRCPFMSLVSHTCTQ